MDHGNLFKETRKCNDLENRDNAFLLRYQDQLDTKIYKTC